MSSTNAPFYKHANIGEGPVRKEFKGELFGKGEGNGRLEGKGE